MFDHGQNKLHKAIGVSEEYLDDLQQKIGDTLKDYLFDENRGMREDASPSELVQACLEEYSYNQLVIMASFFMQNKLEDFTDMMEKKLSSMKKRVKKIALDADDIPPHIREMLMNLAKDGLGDSKSSAINGDDLPQEVKDFLDSIARNSQDADEDDD